MKYQTIYDSEVALFENLRKTYPEEMRDRIVDDGLCWAAISNKMPDKSNRNWPECLWTESKRRVLFFLKNQIEMKAKIIRIGIGRKVQRCLVMF